MDYDFHEQYRVKPGQSVSLAKLPTTTNGPFPKKSHGRAFTAGKVEELRDWQFRLYTQARQSLLIVLQAPDAAGKDGLIRKVLGQMNPQGCRTYPFKVPTAIERAHDFLWRIHQCTPAHGTVAIFNRSHYEDVLVVRVENLVAEKVWRKRYDQINHFEEMLHDSGTKILKIYLHISREEQLRRFEKRLKNPAKHWKLNPSDYTSRADWAAYAEAYEEVFTRCNSERSPWFIIPADRKWYRDAAVAAIVAETFEKMNPQFPEADVDLEQIRHLHQQAEAAIG